MTVKQQKILTVALRKIENTPHKDFLENEKDNLTRFDRVLHDSIISQIGGYLCALRNIGMISETERRVLFAHYATI